MSLFPVFAETDPPANEDCGNTYYFNVVSGKCWKCSPVSRRYDPINADLVATGELGTINGQSVANVISLTKADVGLGSVDNTSDANKPISTAVQTALNLKAGYSSGSGGTVTQLTSKSTAVTLNKICGQITMHNAALAAGAKVAFQVNNSLVASTDVPIVVIQSVGTLGSYIAGVGGVGNGSFSIVLENFSAGSLSQAVVLNFAVLKAVAS